jgi:hypothetical protein
MGRCSSGFSTFQRGCIKTCPADFVRVEDECQFLSDPTQTVRLEIIPTGNVTRALRESERVNRELQDIRTRQSLLDAQDQSATWGTFQQNYAAFPDTNVSIDNTINQLKVKRPPTAPADDLSYMRSLILQGPSIDILMIQIALALAVLSLVSFLFLSRELAQGLSFILLSTGVAIGFFLRS